MAHDPHMHETPTREREVIVTNGSAEPRSGMSGVLVAVLAIIVIAIVGVLVVNAIGGVAEDGADMPSVDVPSEFDVNVDNDGQ